ncbi:MAG: hypothetical protein KAU01_04350 [Candidatus Cloacimonetes bacterium]|nr:hypothetical protein [Candidatus Cloacimonadota bacterium]
MKEIIFITVLLTITFLLSAEILPNAFTPNLLMPSFMNPDKFTMNHSITFMSGFSSNNQGYYQSVYTNHLKYQFSSKLNLQVDLNFVNFGTATYQSGFKFEGNNDNMSKVLPNFQLNYNPTKNTKFTIEFKQHASPNYYNRFWE